MKAKLKILKKTIKAVTTKYGEKRKHVFQLEGSKGPFWADCFANPMTSEWREGDVREMELQSREYEGKTYWNIVTPKAQDFIAEALKRIESKLDRLLGESGEVPGEPDQANPEVPEDDIPF